MREGQVAAARLGTDRILRALAISVVAVAFVLTAGWHASQAQPQEATALFDPSVRSDYSEPVTLASKDGVLEVTLTAHQGHARFDTVAVPVQNMLVFGYKLGSRHRLRTGRCQATISIPRRRCRFSRARR